MKHWIARHGTLAAYAGFVVISMLAVVSVRAEGESVTGAWNMGLQGDHVIPTPLVLKQDGKKVTGTIGLPTQQIGHRVEVELAGEFVDGALTLTGKVENAAEPTTIDLTATLKDDGSLEGKISMGHHMNMPWTAERLRERK